MFSRFGLDPPTTNSGMRRAVENAVETGKERISFGSTS